MDEFKSFDLESKNETVFETNSGEKNYKSALGDFTHLQERIIKFGQSNTMLFLTILIVITFIVTSINFGIYITTDLSFELNGEIRNLNWTKIIIILTFAYSLIMPLAALFITFGCRKLKVGSILKGINLIDILIKINFTLLAIGAVISFITFIPLLFRAFIVVVLIGAIVIGIFYLFFKFLNKALVFSNDVYNAFSSEAATSKIYPEAISLRPLLVLLMIFSILSWLSNLGEDNAVLAQLNADLANVFDKLDLFSHVSFIINLIIFSIALYLTSKFDDFIDIGKPVENNFVHFKESSVRKQPEDSIAKTRVLPKINHEDDDNWHL